MLPIYNPHTAYWSIGSKGARELGVETPTEAVIQKAKEDGDGLYFTVNQVGKITNDNGSLRHCKNIELLTGCFADFDIGTKEEQMKTIREAPVAPSVIIESGRGYHIYFAFKEFCDALYADDWSRVQRAIAKRMGGDSACSDTARLMRLPGSWHVKEGFEPSLVRTVERTMNRYTLVELKEAFGVEQRKHFNLSTGYKATRRLPTMTLGPGARHAALIHEGAKFFKGVAPSEVEDRRASLKAWYVQSCVPLKKGWEEEVNKFVEWVTIKELGG